MNRCTKLLSCVVLVCLSGCTLSDLLFGMFGKGYSVVPEKLERLFMVGLGGGFWVV